VITWPSSTNDGGEDPPSKRAHPLSLLSAFSWYTHGVNFHGAPFLLLLFRYSGFEGNIFFGGRSRTLLAQVVRQLPVAMLALEVLGIGDASQGAIRVTVVSPSVDGREAPGDAVPVPSPSGVMSSELPGPSRPSSASLPVSWGRVENKVELAYS
jgi:hypothetical protein